MKKLLWSTLVCCELIASCSLVLAYSKVAINGQARASSSQDVAFTVSPVYAATPRTVDLRPGEVVNHPSTPNYSTLDKELLAKLDGLSGRNRAQERFHPPASFEHVLSHSNGLRQESTGSASSPLAVGASSNTDVTYSKPLVSMTYDYPQNFDAKPKPAAPSGDSFPAYPPTKFSDSYSSGPSNVDPPSDITVYDSQSPSFDFDHPPKSVEFPGHYDRPFEDAPSYPQEQPFHHDDEIIYDHIPDDHYHHHHHHHPPVTTAEPEMMDQRLNKRPYSYYYIGKKLWYIPLYFSIYFIIYIAALVLKSIARHKINFPANLAAVAAGAESRSRDSPGWMDYVVKVLDGIEKYGNMS